MVTPEDSDTTISMSGELDNLATDVVTARQRTLVQLLAAYQSAATTAGTR